MPSDASTRQRIKEILVESLNLEGTSPESIGDEDPLWGEGLGLDSVDALELMLALEQAYGFEIESEDFEQESMTNIARLAEYVEAQQAARVAQVTESSPAEASPAA